MVQQQALRAALLYKYQYNSENGELTGPRGVVVGSRAYGPYICMKVTTEFGAVAIQLHRAIFLRQNGYLPPLIDHIDRDPSNNRIENLRGASKRLNAHNCDYSRELSRGVDISGGKFTARIKIDGVKVHLGTFDTEKEASDVVELRRDEEIKRG